MQTWRYPGSCTANHVAPPVRVPFSHFVCATLCSASVGTNSGDLLPTWPLPSQQVVPVGVRTKVGEGNGWKNGNTDKESITNACLLVCFVQVFKYVKAKDFILAQKMVF
ncbi:hypothetical protein E2C01_011127 [Portunus trituberculatus]|uniref:Uncharacterized protein n=1 Tax=Portunus trituberculatus TaxID=210409 RepID=A0A5B7DAH8_PORTR|nr:hypothetical protein [Portunus trituberculatus]